jgi:hypothetical protein
MSDDHSKLVIELNGLDRPEIGEVRNVNISASSMKITSMLLVTPGERIIELSCGSAKPLTHSQVINLCDHREDGAAQPPQRPIDCQN